MLPIRFVRRVDGQDLIEYVLLGAFVALIALGGAGALGISVNDWFAAVSSVTKKSNCSAAGAAASNGKCL